MVGLLRGEHTGGLVQDQDVGAAEQGLQDLDALLHAHGQIADDGVERDVEPVVALEGLDLGPGALDPGLERDAALGTQQQILQDRERLDQHEMLVDHADAGADRVLGRADRPLLAADQDGAAVGMVEAVEDVHQGRFAGPVLADDAVDRAGGDHEVDRLIGVDRTEPLVDAAQLDSGRRAHWLVASFSRLGPPSRSGGNRKRALLTAGSSSSP